MNTSTPLSTNKNMFLVGAPFMAPGIDVLNQGAMNRAPTLLLCLFLLSGLTACKIDLSIFGKGTVQTQSGTFDCVGTGTYDENDNPIMTGDCEQTYNVDATEEACDPEDEDCTVVEENDVIPETWVASPEQDGMFNGFAGHCTQGTGSCTHEILYDNANLAQDVLIEAHFEPEPAPQEVTYTHNYLGQMASMTVNNVTTFYVYDEQGRTLSEINEAGESIKDYIYAETERVAWVEKSGDTGDSETEEQVFYPLTNHLGQPFMTIRADEALGHEQYADPFGKVQAMYIDKSLGVDNVGPLPLTDGLPGQRLQPSGYYDNWNRTYRDGRYLQPDPIGLNGGMNPYVYVNNNPVMNIDFYGLTTMPAGGRKTDGYRYREHPKTGKTHHHSANDYANPKGAPVAASDSGTVYKVRQGNGNKANSVTIDHGDGSYSSYSHVTSDVKEGDPVQEGQKIGTTDTSGDVTGPHLHYEYYEDGEGAVDPDEHLKDADPYPYMKQFCALNPTAPNCQPKNYDCP